MKTILIVDDDLSILELFRAFVEKKLGFNVITVNNPLHVIDIVKTNEIDMAFLDVMMPEKNGLDLLKEIKTMGSEFPIVVMTAFTSLKTTITALKEGAYDDIKKPLDIEEVGELITNVIGKPEEGEKPIEETEEEELLDQEIEDIFIDFEYDEEAEKERFTEEIEMAEEQPLVEVEERPEEEPEKSEESQLDNIDKKELFALGYNYFKQKNYKKARIYWEKLLELEPKNKNVLHNLKILEQKEVNKKNRFDISF